MECTVSVILPFFNAEKTLSQAIESIVKQNYNNYELLLINNNSTDGSNKIALEYEKKYPQIKLLHEKKQGVVFASKLGFASSKGKYIARMDSDDIILGQRLLLQATFLDKNTNIQVVSSLVRYSSNFKNTQGFERFVNWSNSIQSTSDIWQNRFVEFPIVNPTLMFRREIAEKYGFYEHGDFPEDYEMFLRWAEKGVKFAKLPQILLQWNDSQSRLTRTHKIYSTDKFYRIKIAYLANWLKETGHTTIAIWGAGRKTRQRSQLIENYGITIDFYIDILPNKTSSKNCILYTEIPEAGKIFIVSFVSIEIARNMIVSFLNSRNYQAEKHYILAG